MDVVSMGYVDQWYATLASVMPAVIGAIIVLFIGWVVGRLLGKGVRILLDKLVETHIISGAESLATLKKEGLTVGYIGDIAVRCVVYLIAIIAAADILDMDYLSSLVTMIVTYIPHIIAFVVILIVGFILSDYFIDFLGKFYEHANVELIKPILIVFRVFLYFVVVILALSQLMLDLTIIYTFVTPIAWGIGLGVGAGIAVVIGFGLKNRSEEIVDKFIGTFLKKE